MTDVEGFDVLDFHARWKRARLAALGRFVEDDSVLDEREALSRVTPGASEELQKEVYLRSRFFGLSALRHFGLAWEVDDLMQVLSASVEVPCLMGRWMVKGSTARVSREGCAPGSGPSAVFCDYWREAIDGLVHGLGHEVGFARQSSAGRGAAVCSDVFFPDRFPEERWCPIPEDLREALEQVVRDFGGKKVELHFEGLLEDELYYRMKHENGALCGAGEKVYKVMLERKVQAFCPGLKLKDATPGAVIR